MMCLLRFASFGLLISCLALLKTACANDAVVTILITDASGAKAFGSGFVASPQGDVITCYHVVEGAVQVSVFYKKGIYDAVIVEIAPDRDTAKIRMLDVTLPTASLPIRYNLPPNLSSSSVWLTMEGYSNGLFDQKIPVHANQDSFALSGKMSNEQGKRLFNKPDVKVLPLTLTVYKGMSGAPIMTQQGEVIGIISGSLNQGGSIGWAIAIENTLSAFTTSVSVPARNFAWPKLTLMPDGWDNLRSQTGIGQDLIVAIDEFNKALNAAQTTFTSECSTDNTVVGGLSTLVHTFDLYPTLANMSEAVMRQPLGQALGTSAMTQINTISPQMDQALAQADSAVKAVNEAKTKLGILKASLSDFEDTLPQTQRNSLIFVQLRLQSSARDSRMASVIQALRDNSTQVHAIIAQQNHRRALVSDYRSEYASMLDAWKVYQRNYCQTLPTVYSGLLEAAVDHRLLLNADVLLPQ